MDSGDIGEKAERLLEELASKLYDSIEQRMSDQGLNEQQKTRRWDEVMDKLSHRDRHMNN